MKSKPFTLIQEVLALSGQNSGLVIQRFYAITDSSNRFMVEINADPSCHIQSSINVFCLNSEKITWNTVFTPPVMAYSDELATMSTYNNKGEANIRSLCDRVFEQFLKIIS